MNLRMHLPASRSRKGLFFLPIVVGMVIASLVIVYVFLSNKYEATNNPLYKIGAKQFVLIDAYESGHAAQVYIDLATSYALPYATSTLAQEGGVIVQERQGSACSAYMYPLWNSEEGDCAPDITVSLSHYLNDALSAYLYQHPLLSALNEPFSTIQLRETGVRQTPQGPARTYAVASVAQEAIIIPVGAGDTFDDSGRASTTGSSSSQSQRPGSGSGQCPDPSSLVEIDPSIPCGKKSGPCLLTTDAAALLKDTSDALAQGALDGSVHTLTINDAYRSLERQQELYAQYCGNRPRGSCPRVAYPSCEGSVPPHLTGGAIDIHVVFFETGPYEVSGYPFTPTQLENQRKLCEFMKSQGWVGYAREWWHFEYGTDRYYRGIKEGVCEII